MHHSDAEIDFTAAASRALQIRKLYNQLEERLHGSAWTNREDMIALSSDIGELGRLVMGAEGRWVHEGDLPKELGEKLSECLWWILVLSERLDIKLTEAFVSKMNALDASLSASVSKQNLDASQ